MNERSRAAAYRLLRIALIVLVLLMVVVVLHPERFLPPDMTLGEFFQAMLGVLMLALVFAAVTLRAWTDYQNKRRNKK
jgi:protein-S-isoprenylcysteine O-methyltransferase Ste14